MAGISGYLSNLEQAKNIVSVFFLDENKGWVVGDSGLLLSTQNGEQYGPHNQAVQ